ncbi:MAG TPA: peroxiredoxin family protein [Burkholderiales bacterium]
MNAGLSLALFSLFLIVAVTAWTNVAHRPLPSGAERAIAFSGVAAASGALALGPGALGYVVAGIALAVSAFMSFLTFMSGLPSQRPAVAVGRAAPDFRGRDADGNEFRLGDRAGSRVVLKFFRGTWCPYCVADLRGWNDLAPELRALGLELVAVSHDTVEELARFKRRHGYDITFVADPDLAIIRRYNLQNRNFTPKRGPFRDMAIPAAILIDVDGKVLWMEQATDFRVRSHPAKVLAAMRAALPAAARKPAHPGYVAAEAL